MKKIIMIMKRILIAMLAVTALASCASKGAASKAIVVYYSQLNSTKAVAEQIATELDIPIVSIEPVVPYDDDFNATIQRGQKEMAGALPEIKPLDVKLEDYDVIFLGYPIWFGTYANPIATLIKENQFEGKTVVPFCTFGSGGLNTSSDALKKALPKADIKKGYGVRTARVAAAPKELDRFLKENGYKDGNIEPLPAYSAQQPVTDEDKAIFDAACSSYQFPLGTPQTVGKRQTAESVDYQFTVKSRGMNGGDATSTIFVTVGKEQGAKPEFTEVVR